MKILIFLFATILSVNSLVFDCKYMMLNHQVGSVYTCIQQFVQSIDASNTLTAVIGNHTLGKSNSDVQFINIAGQSRNTKFPKGIEKFFPNLIAISNSYTNLATLNGDELKPFGELQFFQLNINPSLERIPGNLFSFNPKMQIVDLSYNNIQYVGEHLFDGIGSTLKRLDLSSNRCISQWAQNSTAISSLIELVKVYCVDFEPETPENPSCEKLDAQYQIISRKIDTMSLEIKQKLDLVLMKFPSG